jgi:hypothetical protein
MWWRSRPPQPRTEPTITRCGKGAHFEGAYLLPVHALTLHRGVRILTLMDSAARARRIEGYYYYRPALRGMGWVGVRTA